MKMKFSKNGFPNMKKLELKKEIYSSTCLEMAIAAYSDYAKITVKNTLMIWELTFTKCRYGEDRTVKEFENYLIGMENNQ